MRHKKVEKRKAEPDKVFQNKLAGKSINRLMTDGNETAAQSTLYKAFDLIKEKNQEPLSVFKKAIQNVGPRIEVKARRVGGASYQIPIEVRGDRKISLAAKWVIEAARKRSNKDYHNFSENLV